MGWGSLFEEAFQLYNSSRERRDLHGDDPLVDGPHLLRGLVTSEGAYPLASEPVMHDDANDAGLSLSPGSRQRVHAFVIVRVEFCRGSRLSENRSSLPPLSARHRWFLHSE